MYSTFLFAFVNYNFKKFFAILLFQEGIQIMRQPAMLNWNSSRYFSKWSLFDFYDSISVLLADGQST